jgi:hypothetical protein
MQIFDCETNLVSIITSNNLLQDFIVLNVINAH